VLAELGRGGLATVYKARQLGTNRLVALKLPLDLHGASDRAGEQARRSAEVLARVQHPNIVTVFEAGVYDGRHFCALELCLGESLDRRLGRGPLGPDEAAGLVETLARAIDALHHAGAIHRDLKPSNVLFSGPTPKIAGFGLAAPLDQPPLEEPGAVAGTPAYMAPEQARGEVPLTTVVDVYGLGAVLYQCLTGRRPFQAQTTMDTLLQVTNLAPTAPRQLNPKVPTDLEVICLKCLSKDPAARYASAADLAEDLGRYLRGEPIRARPGGPVGRLWRWLKRRFR
jgi:serine/threonine-protein kinase